MIDPHELWLVIIALGVGSFALRFMFLGLVGRRELPEWALRHLRYTAVSVLPALVAPLVVWPSATGGQTDPARLAAASVALCVGLFTGRVFAAILSGFATLYAMLWLVG
ncbi:putative transmembrane protein [Pseudooceanicola batsensis HTCC2597]|uniref:Putative transmembrane protein n=1 Tax=Pseudooceanicola batsensis (strain ATCC BAA-863 / DSM 15984 / KCTC 12145 / HTCC2597) TaxID=252305 RepID=A3TVA1_PSEBH|nr:AzlD domain-containing protein [Pseudooceanicola batsensis]EAQ04447.1 putative transmembrane protein [Pseudooceanicola batsensis HTCC2597]